MTSSNSIENTGPAVDLSIVVPAYNEQETLDAFHARLSAVLDELGMSAQIVYVNDGSRDATAGVIQRLATADGRVAHVDLSRNFGKEIALTAGLDHAAGRAVIVIDADLQDPPELIPELIAQWREGWDVVYARRTRRDGEGWFKRASAAGFYKVMQGLGGRVRIPANTGDFRLLDRKAVDALLQLREHHRFMKGLFAWIGFRQKAVEYAREPRVAGTTKWNYWQLWNLSIEGITSFTITPLKVATYLGIATSLLAFVYAAYIFIDALVNGSDVAGYPSLMVVILTIGGVQLLAIGILGEYLGRIFNESKNRPLYLIASYTPHRIGGARTPPQQASEAVGEEGVPD